MYLYHVRPHFKAYKYTRNWVSMLRSATVGVSAFFLDQVLNSKVLAEDFKFY